MDDSEGHTYRLRRLCVELPTEMIIRSVPHTVTLTAYTSQRTRPCDTQNSLQSYPTDTPGSPKVVWSKGPSGSAQVRKHPDWPPLSWSLCSLT